MEIKRDAYLRKLIDRQHNGLVKVITVNRLIGALFGKKTKIKKQGYKNSLAFFA